jgi:hypothetical protein
MRTHLKERNDLKFSKNLGSTSNSRRQNLEFRKFHTKGPQSWSETVIWRFLLGTFEMISILYTRKINATIMLKILGASAKKLSHPGFVHPWLNVSDSVCTLTRKTVYKINFRLRISNDATSFRYKTLLRAEVHQKPEHTHPVTLGSLYKVTLPGWTEMSM